MGSREPHSQFEWSLKELGVAVMHAHRAQATGHIERVVKTLQDRLVKELRLAGIARVTAAN